jgi:hypothetical protein
MFADDSKCYRQISRPRDRDLLQNDLNSLHQWSVTWDLNFNAKKCATLKFSRKKTPVPPQNYSLNHQLIKSCSMQNVLDILVSDNLKWSPHINNIVAKANKMLGFLRRNCFHLTDIRARRLLYLSLVRSHLSFGCELHKVRPLICFVSKLRYSTSRYKVRSPGLYIFLCCSFKRT